MGDYVIMNSVAMRARYTTLTDTLIVRICDHLDRTGRLPHLLFLDKSGRPVAWLVRALWPVLARYPGTVFGEGRVPPMPVCHFANIDREQWWNQTGGSETGDIDVNRVPLATIAGLRAAFLTRELAPVPPATIMAATSFLDDCDVLVIDEVSVSGDTLTIARGLVHRAFPAEHGTSVQATHWMTPGMKVNPRSGQREPDDMVIWYTDSTEWGRLVGNRRSANHRGTNWRGRLGIDFLSTVPTQRDRRGLTLRHEAAQLADDVRAGRLLARPSSSRPAADQKERIRVLYGFDDPRAFTAARLDAEAQDL